MIYLPKLVYICKMIQSTKDHAMALEWNGAC